MAFNYKFPCIFLTIYKKCLASGNNGVYAEDMTSEESMWNMASVHISDTPALKL